MSIKNNLYQVTDHDLFVIALSLENGNHYLMWQELSKKYKLTENFIRQHKKKLYWFYISCFQDLSEEFIIEHSDMVDWSSIFKYQNLSEEFKQNFSYKAL